MLERTPAVLRSLLQDLPAFDREAMLRASQGRTLNALLDEFETLRADSLERLDSLALTADDLARQGRTVACVSLGAVTGRASEFAVTRFSR